MSMTRQRRAVVAAAVLLVVALAAAARWRRSTAPPPDDEQPRPPPPWPLDPTEDPADAALFARMLDLVQPYGYPLEMAAVRTTDGHRSLLFRIPHGRRQQQEEASSASPPSSLSSVAPKTEGRSFREEKMRRPRTAKATINSLDREHRHKRRRPVVLLQHGLLGSSADFVLNDPRESLAFVLADAGFDVFLANSRGNEYARGGAAGGGPDSAYYWAWSWDEMAAFDLPAAFAAALLLSGAQELSLVAFSQGTTITLAALATDVLPADTLRQALLLGPVAYAEHVRSTPLRRLADLGTDQALLLLGAREFSPSSELLRRLSGDLCTEAPQLCASALTALCGYNADNADSARIPRYLNYTPSGTSAQNVAHWAQAVRGGRGGGGGGGGGEGDDDDGGGDDERAWASAVTRGRRARVIIASTRRRVLATTLSSPPPRMVAFDYGRACSTPVVRWPRPCNQRVYGTADPPEYDLRALAQQGSRAFVGGVGGAGVVLFTGGRDRLADPEDASELAAVLGRGDAALLRAVHHEPSFEHLDFVWGVKALPRVYDLVARELWDGLGGDRR
jgi:gastric triacylglycerol lipase